MNHIASFLEKYGPSRSSTIAQKLCDEHNMNPDAARKQLSRVRAPIYYFPIPLLPKKEKFFYHLKDRTTERFWINLYADLRGTESVYAAAIDGLIAKGGIVFEEEFTVISGAPVRQIKQVPSVLVLKNLSDAGIVEKRQDADTKIVRIIRDEFGHVNEKEFRTRYLAENILLEGVREWAKLLGIASYHSIAIRGDKHERMVGPYKWDLTGPSYLMPLRKGVTNNEGTGFFVADAFIGQSVNEYQIRYFVRKVRGLQASRKMGAILPLIIARGFTSEALTFGHSAGIIMATPDSLFGKRAGQAFSNLIDVMNNAAAIVAGNPDKLFELFNIIKDIEGRSENIRGVMFELMCAYIIRNQGGSINIGIAAKDTKLNKADIDIQLFKGNAECILFECKSKAPGGIVSIGEVTDWLSRLSIFREHIKSNPHYSETQLSFELWTSGEFSPDALEKLNHEKLLRIKFPINWKSGTQIRDMITKLKEKALREAFDEHFFKHPLKRMQDIF